MPECFVMELTKCPRLFRQVLLKGLLLGFAWEGGRNPVLAALFSLGSLFRMRLVSCEISCQMFQICQLSPLCLFCRALPSRLIL